MRSRGQKQQEYQTPPDVVLIAAQLMLDHVPLSGRPAAMREMVEHQRAVCARMKLPIPEWVDMLAELADEYEKPDVQN